MNKFSASHFVEVESQKARLSVRKIALRVTAWIVPVGILVGSAIYPLRPFVRQALVGVMAIWLYFIAIFGFGDVRG